MKNILWFILAYLGLASNASAYTFSLYHNARFNYQIAYPTFLVPQGESANSDGQIIKSNKARLIVWGSHMPQRIDEAYAAAKIALKDYRITYQVKTPNYFIVSGESDSEIAYFKTIFVCDENINLQLYYPKTEKKAWDAITAEISKSFKFAGTRCQ